MSEARSEPYPLGRRESQTLEFKASDALKKPVSIAREVVAMLNAGGGEIWIGVGESDGIATRLETVPDPERARVDLLNHLQDVIEPALGADDIQVETRSVEGHGLVRVQVTSSSARAPFALLKEGGRHFLRRLDHRIRPMTREEILGGRTSQEFVPSILRARRDEILRGHEAVFWIGVEPEPSLDLDVQSPVLRDLLTDPARSGNRNSGWTFHDPFRGPELTQAGLRVGDAAGEHVMCREHGGAIDLVRSLDRLEGIRRGEIEPEALLEYVVSFVRLVRSIYAALARGRANAVHFDVVLAGARDRVLPSFAPGTMGYVTRHEPPRRLADGVYARTDPLRSSWAHVETNPDAIGFQLVRGIYQALGLPEDRIPSAYDRRLQRLTLTD